MTFLVLALGTDQQELEKVDLSNSSVEIKDREEAHRTVDRVWDQLDELQVSS